MPFSRPTLSTLRSEAQQDVLSDPEVGASLLRFANTRVLARNNADFAHLQYGFIDWISKQAVPFTCTDEYLEAWAGLKAVTRKPAVAAVLAASFTGTPGTQLLGGTPVIAVDGSEFTIQATATADGGGNVAVNIVAVEAGAAGNLASGTVVALGTAVAGIQSGGTIGASVTAGADVESDDDLRSRMLEAFANPPQGGANADYVTWALELSGVTRAWVAPLAMGAGTVSVYFMMDNAEATHGGFPQGTNGVAAAETRASPATGDQLELANFLYPLRPTTALVYAVAPTANPIAFTIKGVPSGLQSAVAAAIVDLFLSNGTPGGVTLANGSAGGTIEIKDVWAAIDAVAGIGDYTVVSPTADIVSGAGQLATVGTITWE